MGIIIIIIIIFFKKRKLCFKEPRFRWNFFLWAEGIFSVMWATVEIPRTLHTWRVHTIEHKV